MKYLLAFVTLGVFIASQASGATSSLDEFIAAELDAADLPGVAYAIVDNGTTVSGAYGDADLNTGKAIASDTPFQIASISKSFTAIAILQLAEAGNVELDKEMSLYLDVFRDSPAGAITIRQLLAHTSGYSTRQGNELHVDRSGARMRFPDKSNGLRAGRQLTHRGPNGITRMRITSSWAL